MLKGYKNAPESGSLRISPIPSPRAGGAGALNNLGRTTKGEAILNSLLWGWLPGYDVSSVGSWVSTKEYGVERVYSCSMSRKSIIHLGWLMPVPYSQPSGHQLVAQCMVAAQEQHIFVKIVNASPFIESSACQDDDAHRAVVPPPCQSQWIIFFPMDHLLAFSVMKPVSPK